MEKITKQSERWWRVPLSVSHHGRPLQALAMLLCAMMLLVPQRAGAVTGSDWGEQYSFLYRYLLETDNYSKDDSKLKYERNNNGNNPYIQFTVGYACAYMHYKEGFMETGNGLDIWASKDGGKSWVKIINIYTNENFTCFVRNQTSGCNKYDNSYTTKEYTIGSYYHQKIRWNLPVQWRNCNIQLKCTGIWCKQDGSGSGTLPEKDANGKPKNENKTIFNISTPYTFSVRNIYWNTTWSLAPDGTLTIPYKFSQTACNTDGNTFIGTRIDNSDSEAIGKRNENSTNFENGSYTFKMSTIGKTMTSNFKIRPFHEFKHDNDMDNNNGVKAYWHYADEGGSVISFSAFPQATLQEPLVFNQQDKLVTLQWTASNTNYLIGHHKTKWAIYRNGEFLDFVYQDANPEKEKSEIMKYTNYKGEVVSYFPYNSGTWTYYDTTFPNDENVTYQVYFVWKEWDETKVKVDELKSTNTLSVKTERKLPIKEPKCTADNDQITFTWASTGYEADWGNEFKFYMVDKDGNKTLLVDIVPKNNQTNYKVIHRTGNGSRKVTEESDPSGVYPVVYVIEEPLNACEPHDYIIEGLIDGDVITTTTLEKRAVGTATLIESLEATKGSYPGTVKLSWTVNKHGSTTSKDYEIYRRVADSANGTFEYLETISSSESRLRYNDVTALPGVFYEYQVKVIDKCDDGTEITDDKTDIGFAQTTGTISGRVTYGSSGSSVEGVQVLVEKTGTSGDDENQYHALHFTGNDGYVAWTYPNDTYAADKFSAKDFTLQLWLYPESLGECWLARFGSKTGSEPSVVALGMNADGQLRFTDGTNVIPFNLSVQTGKYSHVALTRSGGTLTCYVITFDVNGNPVVQTDTQTLEGSGLPLQDAKQFELGYVKGFADEFRLWTKCLSKDEILENCDHLLVGNEKGLETYFTFDEGLSSQFFDYSREGTNYHQHHGKMVQNTEAATTTPGQLALKARTDKDGNYIIQGIPFSGEGTNFNVRPSYNSHQFSPEKQSRFISSSSLVHNSVDFTDVSSFEVSGTIIYAGTNIPVDSVYIYVDGSAVARNNELVVTNEDGEFVIDVPIGKHYISAVREGHTFVNEGRIPEDPTGLNEEMMEFKNPVSGLRFIDNTLVPIAGRVVGGAIEGDKPLGFGQSENNIGKAVITLEIPDTRYIMNAVEETDGLVSTGFRPVATNTDVPTIEGMTKPGVAYRTGGAYDNDAKKVVITTDGETGEFGVMLPPLDYKVLSVVMENAEGQANYTFNPEQLPRIDASDATTVLKDSVPTENGGFSYFDYVAAFKQTLHTQPVLNVTQQEAPEGAFGDDKAYYVDLNNGRKVKADLYSVAKNGAVTYNFGFPIFSETATYKFDLEGYETYTNYDNGRTSIVPLKDVVVTISNAMSSSQEVYRADAPENPGQIVDLKSNQLLLDETGKATYTWKGGFPNIQGDYTRTLNMTYNNGAGEYKWKGNTNEGLTGIVFGDLPSGTNYTTQGPDKVEMIIHDPYGDSSFATWETGKVTVHTQDILKTSAEANNFMTNIHLGPDIVTSVQAFFVSTQSENDAILDNSHGFDRLEQKDSIGSYTTTLEVTKAISTSSDPDFIGADGDIYIGKSTNLLFGKARSVGLKANPSGTPEVMVDDAIIVGNEFATNFVYTQYQIENVIIPNLKTMRNDLLTQVADTATYVNNTGATMYVTELSKDDEHFGEPGTYKVLIVKKGDEDMQADEMTNYNSAIKNWEDRIAENEKYKIETFKKGYGKKNVSFGGGSEISESTTETNDTVFTVTYTSSYSYNMFFNIGYIWNGMGGDIETTLNQITESSSSNTDEEENSATFSYTLADSGADDSFSMDIYPATTGHGPLFRTLGGQTSCPYEGEVLTKYYNPENEKLSEATMQIEQPEIACDNNMLTGVPTGGQAQFELLLRNNSITKTDCYFNLIPLDGENPKGARLSLPTGPIGNGRTVLVPAGETVKMILTLEQVNMAVTKYDDIKLALTSTCQDDLRSEVSLSAEFVPASTPVTLTMDKMTVNTANVNSGVQFTVKGFDRNFAGLQSVDLQYMEPGKQTWSLLQSYIPSESVRANNSQELLPENGVIELPIDMREAKWADGTYQFRAQSSTLYSGKTVTAESDVLTLVKDLKRPQLFGAASPSDGVLNGGDEISVTFNEDIQKEMLTKNNIIVSGVLNGYELQHDVALSAQGTERAAYTQAGFNLAKKSFSADMWVRVTEAGDILTHGNGDEKFKLSIDANDKLVASIGGNDYVSTNAIEKDTWTFLTFSYNYDEGSSHLYARAVTANDTKDMFANVAVADYAGSGSITLGQNFKGAIHELTLWDKARTMQEAQAEMYFTKKPSTPNLIGYWKMDEGNGNEIRDYARSRHLTMPASTWYLNNDNKAVTLDGTKTLKLNIASCNSMPADDYAVEMWFKGAKADQSAASTLFAANTNSVGIGFNANGGLTMKANGSDTELTSTNVLDNAWHHLALNVLRNGNATAYVDGKAVKTFSASAVPALEGTFLNVGSSFKGLVDEIRIWNASMTGDLLSSQRTQRLVGDESGLAAYYSFEKMTRDPNNGLITSVSNDEDLTGSGLKAEVVTSTSTTPQLPNYTDEAPALKVKPEATNVEYNYVANERGIIITLNETPARLEGTTLQFTVRAVQDLNGNESNAASWTAFVRQNSLLWKSETDVTLEKQVGEPATFEATFANESGTSENWTLTGLPSWLTASATSGTLKAQLSKTITFTVAESVPTGKYEETIYLTGNDNISEPLTLNLKVKAEEPDWAVNRSGYSETMNLVGSLQILDVPCRDEDNIVAAFVGTECRGVAHPEYVSRYDSYFVTMDIYGSSDDDEVPLTLKVFEASTGIIYPVVKAYFGGELMTPEFGTDNLLGTFKDPVILNATDEVEQNIDLALGWNWMSLGVKPGTKPEDFTVEKVFTNADGKVDFMKGSGTNMKAEFDGEIWLNGTLAMNNREMYAVQTNDDLTLSVTGHKVKSDEEPITVKNGWSWVAFNSLSVMSLDEALAGMNPQDDEIIKGQRGVAFYDTYEWVGSLKQLTPGLGYKIQGKEARSFTYPTKTVAAARREKVIEKSQTSNLNAQTSTFTPVDYHNYPGNMVLIAQLVADGQPVEGVELGVFAGEECREAAVSDERGMIIITIPGDKPCELTFRVSDGESSIFNLQSSITYENDAVIGAPKAPFIIDLGQATGIADNNRETLDNSGDVYDLQGRKVELNDQGRKLRKGVYVVNGQKKVK